MANYTPVLEDAIASLRGSVSNPSRHENIVQTLASRSESPGLSRTGILIDEVQRTAAVADVISGGGGRETIRLAINLGERIVEDIHNASDEFLHDYVEGIRIARGLISDTLRQARQFPTKATFDAMLKGTFPDDAASCELLDLALSVNAKTLSPVRHKTKPGIVPVARIPGNMFGYIPLGSIEAAQIYSLDAFTGMEMEILGKAGASPKILVGTAAEPSMRAIFAARPRHDLLAVVSSRQDAGSLRRLLRMDKDSSAKTVAITSDVVVNDAGTFLIDAQTPYKGSLETGLLLSEFPDGARWPLLDSVHRQSQSMSAHGYCDAMQLSGMMEALKTTLAHLPGAKSRGAMAVLDEFGKIKPEHESLHLPIRMLDRSIRQVSDAIVKSLNPAPSEDLAPPSFDIGGGRPGAAPETSRSEPPDPPNIVSRVLDVILTSRRPDAASSVVAAGLQVTLVAIARLLGSPVLGRAGDPIRADLDKPIMLRVNCRGFIARSPTDFELQIPADRDSDPVAFILEMMPADKYWIGISALQDGKLLGSVSFDGADFSGAAEKTSIDRGTAADLTLFVREPDGAVEGFGPWSPEPEKGHLFGTMKPLDSGIADQLRAQLKVLSTRASNLGELEHQLQLIGSQLAELVPPELIKAFCDDPPKTIFLFHGTKFDFPFELVLIPDDKDGYFLGDKVPICRWYMDVKGARQKEQIDIAQAAVLIGKTPVADLDLALLKGRCAVDPFKAPLAVRTQVLGESKYTLLHFIGHCGQEKMQDANLELKGGLLPMQEIGRLRSGRKFGEMAPLVVLNGCATANPYPAFSGEQSFSFRFLQANAGAFVGTLWPVHESVANEFTRTFYEHLAKGIPLAEAMRNTKTEIAGARHDGNSRALSVRERALRRISARGYSAFGNPNLKVSFTAHQSQGDVHGKQ